MQQLLKKITTFFHNNYWSTPQKKMWTIWLLFVLSRIVILAFPPFEYSDVTFYYERYANAWEYGLPPYTHYLFEYPPAAVPILWIPLKLDLMGIGQYYINYRVLTFFFADLSLFAGIFWLCGRLSWLKARKWSILLWYILTSHIAKNFWYEGVDLSFTAAVMFSYVALFFFPKQTWWQRVISWSFLWLSAAIKFLTFPLIWPWFLFNRREWKRDIAVGILSFLIIWAVPIAIFRSSLSVSFVYNWQRGIKYSSFPAHVIQWANVFTQSEVQKQKEPDFEYMGPVSDVVTKTVKVIFPISLALVMLYITWVYFRAQNKKLNLKNAITTVFKPEGIPVESQLRYLLAAHGLYLFTLFITAKIFSQPFHMWYLPLVAMYPWRSWKTAKIAMFFSTLLILMDITTLLSFPENWYILPNLKVRLVRDLFRFLPMVWFIKEFVVDLRSQSEARK
jgi:hypothetical protein